MNSENNRKRCLELLQKWGWEIGPQQLSIVADQEADQQLVQQFLGWMAAERGDFGKAEAGLSPLTDVPELAGWAHLGLAFIAMRARRTDEGLSRLEEAENVAGDDSILLGCIRTLQATTHFHAGRATEALPLLEEAAHLIGPECFSRGRVLDSLGMWYASQGNVQAAVEFFQQALDHKKQFHDDAGQAVTWGQLGRLHLDWGQLDLAERCFRTDLDICRRIDDRRGESQMHNFLGIVALEHGDAENAEAYLQHAVNAAQSGQWPLIEGYARKDLAHCRVQTGDAEKAAHELDTARRLFTEAEFSEGLAHVRRIQGLLHRILEEWTESERELRQALRFFAQRGMSAEVAKVRLELARTLKSQGEPLPLVRDEFLQAVRSADESRRPHLVQEADRELAEVDPIAGARHVYQRVRGRRIDEDATSLTTAEQDTVTMFFFDLQGFTAWSRNTDPSIVMLSLNQMMAEFLDATQRHEVQVIEYMGDGFLAMSRGPKHARRAVQAALDLHTALDQFNRPRRILNLPEFVSRIGVSTGEVVLGNVGTYEKIDNRAVGTTVNLAARIQNFAVPGSPCISRATWEVVQSAFEFSCASPRTVQLKGIGDVQVWDVRQV